MRGYDYNPMDFFIILVTILLLGAALIYILAVMFPSATWLKFW